MRGKITKQVEMTTVTVAKMVVNDGVAAIENVEPFSVIGKINERAALKAAQEKHGAGTYSVISLTNSTKAYEMDLEKFIASATEISIEQAKKNNK